MDVYALDPFALPSAPLALPPPLALLGKLRAKFLLLQQALRRAPAQTASCGEGTAAEQGSQASDLTNPACADHLYAAAGAQEEGEGSQDPAALTQLLQLSSTSGHECSKAYKVLASKAGLLGRPAAAGVKVQRHSGYHSDEDYGMLGKRSRRTPVVLGRKTGKRARAGAPAEREDGALDRWESCNTVGRAGGQLMRGRLGGEVRGAGGQGTVWLGGGEAGGD